MKGKKTGGRSKGTPNKTTNEVREIVKSFVVNNLVSIQEDFSTLEAKDKLFFLEKLLKYVLPVPTEQGELQETDKITPTYIDWGFGSLNMKDEGE